MLDSFDVMLYAMVGAALINDPTLHLSFQTNGLLGSITQLAAAAGGIVFAVIADRLGRKRALMGAILMYSIFTAACGFSQTVTQLAVFRVLPRPRHGRRVGDRRGARLGVVSRAAPRQGARLRAELVGDRLRLRRAGQPARDAALGLARRLLRRRHPGALHDVDPPQRRGAEDLARVDRRPIAAASACSSRRGSRRSRSS